MAARAQPREGAPVQQQQRVAARACSGSGRGLALGLGLGIGLGIGLGLALGIGLGLGLGFGWLRAPLASATTSEGLSQPGSCSSMSEGQLAAWRTMRQTAEPRHSSSVSSCMSMPPDGPSTSFASWSYVHAKPSPMCRSGIRRLRLLTVCRLAASSLPVYAVTAAAAQMSSSPAQPAADSAYGSATMPVLIRLLHTVTATCGQLRPGPSTSMLDLGLSEPLLWNETRRQLENSDSFSAPSRAASFALRKATLARSIDRLSARDRIVATPRPDEVRGPTTGSSSGAVLSSAAHDEPNPPHDMRPGARPLRPGAPLPSARPLRHERKRNPRLIRLGGGNHPPSETCRIVSSGRPGAGPAKS